MSFLLTLIQNLGKLLSFTYLKSKELLTLGSASTPPPAQRSGMNYPYSEIAALLHLYTEDSIQRGDPNYSAHEKILRCMKEMDTIIKDLVMRNPDCLLHPNKRVRNLAKDKFNGK